MKKLYLYTFLFFLFSFSALADECIEGDCRNGTGTFLTSSGDKYIGEWRDNTFKGGTFISADGKSYPIGCIEGECNDGYGTYRWHSGSSYVGEWKEGKFYGRGTFFYSNGDIYEGEFSNGKKHGQGKLTEGPCYYYEGEWKKDERNGQGVEFECIEGLYEGEFKNDAYNGKGAFYFSCCCGDTSETTYKNHGYCNYYEGEFKDGKFHGHGKFTMGDETTEGEWEKGALKRKYFFDGKELSSEEFNPNVRCQAEGNSKTLISFDYAVISELGPPDYPPIRQHIYLEENNIIKKLVFLDISEPAEDVFIMEYFDEQNIEGAKIIHDYSEGTPNIRYLIGQYGAGNIQFRKTEVDEMRNFIDLSEYTCKFNF